MKVHTTTASSSSPRLSFAGVEEKLTKDALLAEIDELAEWSAYQDIQTMLGESPSHRSIQISY